MASINTHIDNSFKLADLEETVTPAIEGEQTAVACLVAIIFLCL